MMQLREHVLRQQVLLALCKFDSICGVSLGPRGFVVEEISLYA